VLQSDVHRGLVAVPAFATCSTIQFLNWNSHDTKVIAFADDLIILTKEGSIVEAENYMSLELRKI